jgi:putative transposase
VKLALLGLLEQAVAGGWSRGKACHVLGLDERRARRWQVRAEAGELADRPAGGHPVHGLMPSEIAEILALADDWGETDCSHRKLAHRGSYTGRVWVSPATVFRVLVEHGRALPHRIAREPQVRAPWPDWVQYRPNQVWGYDLTAFAAARTQALAIVDLVSRRWIDHLLCPEATSLQVQVLFTRALDAEGLLGGIVGRAERLANPASPDTDQPVLLAVSDNGPQMTSGSTREFMALHAIATHFGRPGVPTDQAPVESFFGHLKHEWAHLCQLADPGDLDRELVAVRASYNGVRLHAGIGYVTPDDEHAGRGPAIRHARRVGLARARHARLTYHRQHNSQPPS